ncbi:MAG: hypothetical protein K2H45_01660, partial [Acetatifactor sp.]|nr:hypothetical protein [Acetatifactor sp.]
LLMREEGLKETANRMIYIGKPIEYDDELFEQQLQRLQEASVNESQDIRVLVQEIVPGYQYEE